MNKKKTIKIAVDCLMVTAMPPLIAYSLIGESNHEWLGMGMFALFILHHILNFGWIKGLFRGRYNRVRIVVTAVNASMLILMLVQMCAGIMLSKHIFKSLDITADISKIRLVHLCVPYWLYLITSLHLGFHMKMVTAKLKNKNVLLQIIMALALSVSAYGAYAFHKRRFTDYMFLKVQFAFFDFTESRMLFILDYLAVMVLFTVIGYCLMKVLTYTKNQNKERSSYEKNDQKCRSISTFCGNVPVYSLRFVF